MSLEQSVQRLAEIDNTHGRPIKLYAEENARRAHELVTLTHPGNIAYEGVVRAITTFFAGVEKQTQDIRNQQVGTLANDARTQYWSVVEGSAYANDPDGPFELSSRATTHAHELQEDAEETLTTIAAGKEQMLGLLKFVVDVVAQQGDSLYADAMLVAQDGDKIVEGSQALQHRWTEES